MMKRLFLSIPLGINVRDVLRLGTLDAILAADPAVEVFILTPARLVAEFVDEFSSPRVRIVNHQRFRVTERLGRLSALRRRTRSPLVRRALLRLETAIVSPSAELRELFRASPPSLVITVHPQDWWDWDLIVYARKLGIPTAGILRSWDNIQRGLNVIPDRLAVWNAQNASEAMTLEGFDAGDVQVVGPLPFDPYFDRSVLQPRETFFKSLGFDPSRPMIVYAPAGQTMDYGDETRPFEDLLAVRARNPALTNAQVVCRLHPATMLQNFWPYRERGSITFSFGSYIKTLGWSMTRDEVVHMANLLAHADAIVCGATTVVVEAAAFDTPTIVVAFNDVQPEHVERYLKGWTFAKHFRPIVENAWVPIARSVDEMETMLVTALQDRAWYAQQRKAMSEYYIPFKDGSIPRRVATWLLGEPIAPGNPS